MADISRRRFLLLFSSGLSMLGLNSLPLPPRITALLGGECSFCRAWNKELFGVVESDSVPRICRECVALCIGDSSPSELGPSILIAETGEVQRDEAIKYVRSLTAGYSADDRSVLDDFLQRIGARLPASEPVGIPKVSTNTLRGRTCSFCGKDALEHNQFVYGFAAQICEVCILDGSRAFAEGLLSKA